MFDRMKKINFLLTMLLIAVTTYGQVDRSRAPAPGPARVIKIGEYQSFTLKNGLQVFVVENHKLPRVQFSLQLRHDAILEGGKAGYVSMAGDLIGTGTKNRTKAELDEQIDFIGAALHTSASGIYASSLTKHTPVLLDLMTDVLYNPAFDSAELEKIKTQTLSAITANKEDPEAIASDVRSVLLFGKDHPYGEIVTEKTVGDITLDDCKQYYSTYFKPNNAYLAIVGDIDLKSAKKLVDKNFSKWKSGAIPDQTFPTPQRPQKTYVALVDRPSSVQSVITIAHPVELKPGSPDAIRAGVMNNILGGGGLSSRLNQNLREDKAFTYGAHSSLSSDKLIGSFDADASVRNEVTDSAVYELLHEIKRIENEPVTDEELSSAKAYISGSFGRSLESPGTIANFAINTAKYDLPKDYYDNYVKNVAAVSKEDVQNVAKKLIHPDQAYILLVAKGSEVSSKLEKFGDVKYYDIYGNEYTPSKSAALPAGLTADKVIQTYIEALGGADKINAIKTVKSSSKASVPGAELIINSVQQAPNKAVVEILANGMIFQKIICDGKDVSIMQMGQKTPVDETTKEETIFDSYLVPELFHDAAGVKLKLTGIEKVDERDAYVVEYTFPSGSKSDVYFDTETGLKVRSVKALDTPQGKMTQSISYQDYKPEEGVQFPRTIVQNVGPQTLKAEITSMEINVPAQPDLFKIE
jgi:zinc protease